MCLDPRKPLKSLCKKGSINQGQIKEKNSPVSAITRPKMEVERTIKVNNAIKQIIIGKWSQIYSHLRIAILI